LSATSPDTGQTRVVSNAAASSAAASAGPPRRLGLALAVIATAQLMVVLDATIVNVALPHIQTALGFSGSNLEWVVNAYALAFGGLLLLGGRSGDLLGRRRIFIFGILLFSLASLLGGFATTQEWLLGARVLQGIGGAFAAPTALSLIAVTFPEGQPRNRAMGVYAAMSVAGGAVGLIAGGLLVQYLDCPRGATAQPGDGRVRRDERGRRCGRPDRGRPAGPVPRLALGVLGERADRPAGRVFRDSGAARVGAAPRRLRPAGRDYRLAGSRLAGLRAIERRDQPERCLALG